mmetsp:Transcript_97422/g.231806  ORF Transcript_97422/g.231806 Transcript_97422/m.231806 type:complete len:223 (-) Transcript_97422:287-955(-)
MISCAKGSRASLYWLTRPSGRRSRMSICTAFSWQFTRNCRREETDSEASVPKPVCSFRSSMTSTVGPSSMNRYSLRITSSAGSSAQSCLFASSVAVLAFGRPASWRSTASPERAACSALASATNSRARVSLPMSRQVFARSLATIDANSSLVWEVEKLRWKRTASRGWPSASSQARLQSSSHLSASFRRPSLRQTAPSCCSRTQCSQGSGWPARPTYSKAFS